MRRLDDQIVLMSMVDHSQQWTWPATSCRFDPIASSDQAGTGSSDCYARSELVAYIEAVESNGIHGLVRSLDEAGLIMPVSQAWPAHQATYCAPTSSTIRLLKEVVDHQPAAKPVDEMVAHVRGSFGLNVTEMARVLRVERPTIYSWLSGKSLPQESNLLRLLVLERCAQRWDQLSAGPAKSVLKVPLTGGLSLLEQFQQETLAEKELLRQLDLVAQQMADRRSPTVRERLRARGESVTPGTDQSDVIDSITGRRIEVD